MMIRRRLKHLIRFPRLAVKSSTSLLPNANTALAAKKGKRKASNKREAWEIGNLLPVEPKAK